MDREHGLDGLLFLARQRLATEQHVQRFAGNGLAGLLAHLFARKMDQNVGNADHRVVLVLADDHVHQRAVLLGHHAVQGHGTGHPLVLFDAAVIVGVGIGQIGVLVEGVLLEVDAGRVNVCAHDVDAFGQGSFAQMEEHNGLAHAVHIDLVAGLEGLARLDGIVQVDVTGSFGGSDGFGHAFALGFAVVQKYPVFLADLLQLVQGCFVILFPRVGSFHGQYLQFVDINRDSVARF